MSKRNLACDKLAETKAASCRRVFIMPNSAVQQVEYGAKRQWLDLWSPVMNGKYHFCWPAIKNNSHRRTELAVRERISDQIAKQLS